MSASVYWEPLHKSADSLFLMAPQAFMQMLARIVGRDRPWELDKEDLPAMRGAIAAVTDSYMRKALEDLVEGIEKHGAISVWAEY